MKNIYALLSLFVMTFVCAQTTIYAENFGTPASTTLLTAYTGYQNSAPVTYSGTADVRTSTPSDYAGASGSGCVFFAGVTTASGIPVKTLIISGIDTRDYTNLALSFGQQKGTNVSSNELKVEVSEDGTNWTALTYTRPTGAGTSIWAVITPTGAIPAVQNLYIKFTNTVDSNAGFRVDDLKLTGTMVLAAESSRKESFNIYPTSVTAGKIYVTSSQNGLKNIKIYDASAKLLMNTSTQKEVNVSKLTKGTYIVNVEENGMVASKKIIIK